MEENVGSVLVCLVLTEAIEPIEAPIPVTFTTVDDTALGTYVRAYARVLEFMIASPRYAG